MMDSLLARVAERFATVRRDVAMVTGALRGERAPLLVKRSAQQPRSLLLGDDPTGPTFEPSASAPAAPIRSLAPRTVTVVDVLHETPSCVTLVVEEQSDSALSEAFGSFKPGQFVTVVVKLDGVEYRRAYSVSSTAEQFPRWAITIKRMQDGKISNYLNERSVVGGTLSVLGPSGNFVLGPSRAPADSVRQLLFIAGGSGITPIYSMIRSLLASDESVRATLVYGNYNPEAMIFRDALSTLALQHPERLKLITVLEHGSEVDSLQGRLDPAMIESILTAQELASHVECFVCGPEPVMDAARSVLSALGIEKSAIREEKFSSPQKRVSEAERAVGSDEFMATFMLKGRPRLVTIRPGKTLLESGIEAGLDLPFSCTMGGCGACKSKLVRGSVSMVEPNCLLPSEATEGEILPCVSTCLSDVTVEVAS